MAFKEEAWRRLLHERGLDESAVSVACETGIVYGWSDETPGRQCFGIQCIKCEPRFGLTHLVDQESLQKSRVLVAEAVEQRVTAAFEPLAQTNECPHWPQYRLVKEAQ